MGATADRDERWLEHQFRRHHQAVLAYARRRVSAHEADDVLAEVFATAWRHRHRVPDEALPWLYRTASHHVLHLLRDDARRSRLTERVVATSAQPWTEDPTENLVTTLDDRARVLAALKQLPPRDAELLRLEGWERLDMVQLAYVLGCSVPAVRVRLHRARRRFAAILHSGPSRPDPATASKETGR